MESLFKLTELESRIPLNLNVLVEGPDPEGARPRRSPAGMARPPPRRAAAPLQLPPAPDRQPRSKCSAATSSPISISTSVISIIRTEDEPKPVLIGALSSLSDVQAEAILNMRLRNLRSLEEHGDPDRGPEFAHREAQELQELVKSEPDQWKKIADEIKAVRTGFGPKTPLGKRRTTFFAGARARRGGDRARRWRSASRSPWSCRRRAGSARSRAL